MRDFLDLLGLCGLKILRALLLLIPEKVALSLGRFMGVVIYYFTKRRKQAYADMKAALDPAMSSETRRQLARRLFKHFGQMAFEMLCTSAMDVEHFRKYAVCHHEERLADAMKKKRGVILLTAHLGNWELLQFVPGFLGEPIHVLARPQKFPRMDAYLKRLRESHGLTVTASTGMGIRDYYRTLKRNGLVGLVGDRAAGKSGGVITSFLGRKTTFPTGAFDLAHRTGAELVPLFTLRREGTCHNVFFEEPVDCSNYDASKVEEKDSPLQKYIATLEQYIRNDPDQWHWLGKRWKYSWTKRLLILSDGKPGHVKQSQAIAQHFQNVKSQYGREGMEYPCQTLEVKFKSKWHERLFFTFAFLFIPFAQGHLSWVKGFFEKRTADQLEQAGADFIISAGSGLVPLNLCLAKENCAKSIVLMKPGFPYSMYPCDLAVIPAHDHGMISRKAYRPLLTPNPVEASTLERDAGKLKKTLRDPARIKISVFLGGNTRKFQMSLSSLEVLFSELSRLSKKMGDYLITTSRRTPDTVVDYFRPRVLQDPNCQLFVVAKEDTRPEVMGGMIALADILIVTEDSVSMISEAVSSGKKVIVISFGGQGLPEKHLRFQKLLEERKAIRVCICEKLEEALNSMNQMSSLSLAEFESAELDKKLQAIL